MARWRTAFSDWLQCGRSHARWGYRSLSTGLWVFSKENRFVCCCGITVSTRRSKSAALYSAVLLTLPLLSPSCRDTCRTGPEPTLPTSF